MSNPTLEKSNCESLIRTLWKNAQIRIEYASGGLIVEVVDTGLKPANKLQDQRTIIEKNIDFNSKQPDINGRFTIHRLFTHETELERYKIGALLHTKRADYNEDGIYTSYLQSGDAKAWMTEFDAATLIFDGRRPYSFTVFSDLKPTDLFAIIPNGGYQEIEFEGEARAIREIKPGSDRQHWIIELAD